MNILQKIKEYSITKPDTIAMQCDNLSITYKELEESSSKLAAYIERTAGSDKSPVAVYGHKSPYMLVCFLALVKSGRGYCPIDISVPEQRVHQILDALDSKFCLAVEPLEYKNKKVISLPDIRSILYTEQETIEEHMAVGANDIFYMIFTSGSTGIPKGVMITRANLEHYLDWSVTLGTTHAEKDGKVFLNQAPFSFDLSVMDVYTCLSCGGTLWSLTKETQTDYKKLYNSLIASHISIWVSTPSFVEICMTDPVFSEVSLPELNLFLFCGETLTPQTARKLKKRFPNAIIMNTYGPTESTVAVTGVLIDAQYLSSDNPLPVGMAKPGTRIEIHDKEGHILPEGEKGEIHIVGDTVSAGYYKNPKITSQAFYEISRNGEFVRGYRTGDEGYLLNGMLYYCGRMDLQIKLHGYRIELEDIENNILRLPRIRQAVVVPNVKKGAVKSLTAYIVSTETEGNIKNALAKLLPHYMIPKKIILMEKLPVTNNGKTDRKLLGGMAS